MIPRLDGLVGAVQANCHVSDARHARNMTLCTYLLEMREFYRWEHGVPPTAPLPRADVAAWLAEREALWARFEDAEYRPLPLGDGKVDPFDVEAMNRTLVPHGLVYGAGVGRFGKPQFFLGALEREERRDGVRILVARCEYARDLAPAAATLREGTVTVRLESLRRMLWEKIEGWTLKRRDGALRAALDAYDFGAGADAALERMAAAEAESVILHELGEARAARLLGARWETMLCAMTSRRAETFARAARDHLADCLVTLPALLDDDGASASLHLWFANLDGMRRELFPRLLEAYAARPAAADALRAGVRAGAAHWERVCRRLLALHEERGTDAVRAIEALAGSAEVRL
jgi:hypothetical protein